jgi:DNA-binding response OmpR family regulator
MRSIEQPEVAVGAGARPCARILVVDDDRHFLNVLARILKAEAFQVCCAADADEAIQILNHDPIDVVISDWRMPECDGLRLLQQVRASANRVPVIILTAYDEPDSYLEAMNAGASGFLHKPVQTEELLQTVRTCLSSSHTHRC